MMSQQRRLRKNRQVGEPEENKVMKTQRTKSQRKRRVNSIKNCRGKEGRGLRKRLSRDGNEEIIRKTLERALLVQ